VNDSRLSPWLVAVAALTVIGLAAFFRLHQLDTVPPGLFFDEAQNGLDALSIARGESFPVFVEAGSAKSRGREPMLHYLMAGTFRLGGTTVWSIRLTVALIGIVTVALFFLLGVRLFGLRVAFVSAALLAVSRWHVTMSRVGVRAILTPLWIILVFVALRRLVQRRTLGSGLLFGAVVGAGFYTYPAFWVVPGALVVVLLLMILFGRVQWRRSDALVTFVAAVSFFVVTSPLIHYAMVKPDYFFARASDLSMDLRASDDRSAMLRDHLQRGLFMLHFRGDQSPMYNIPGRPFLDPLSGVAFAVGLFVILRELPRQSVLHGALLCLWLLPLVPGVMTATGSWGMRSIGAVPAVFLIAGVGLSRLTRRPIPWLALPRWASGLLLASVLATVGVLNYHDYFENWANDPGVQGSYATDVVRFFDFSAELAGENDVYVSPYVYNSPNFRFLDVERSADLRLLGGVGDLTDHKGRRRGRVFISDYAPVTGVIGRIYPNHEEVGRYSVWGRSGGVVLRVRADQLKPSLSEAQRLEANYWIGRMREEFEASTQDW
jgi:4-amino-4-deoxy-L-arabinose transferase-like glycosyltransferase